MDHVHLGVVVRVLAHAQLGAPRVNVLADPHAPEPVAALDADPPVGRLIDEVADRADDFLFFVVDAHRRDGSKLLRIANEIADGRSQIAGRQADSQGSFS